MISIVLGLFFIALGIWGIFDEYYYVADFLKGALPVVLMLCGSVAVLAGCMPYKTPKNKPENKPENMPENMEDNSNA